MKIHISLLALILFCLQTSLLAIDKIERRRSQFQNEFGYIVTPLPFILPGVGTGIGLLSGLNNIYETPVDLYLVFIRGDVEGAILGITDIHLLPERLLLDLTRVEFNKGQQNRYLKRGMDSDPSDFNIVELSDSRLQGGRMILSFYERMLEFYTIAYNINFKISAIRDNSGNLINEIDDPATLNATTTTFGTLLDYTDDRTDPKQGSRLLIERSNSPPSDDSGVDYYVMNYNLTGYFPLFSYSTLALNYFRSDAHVIRQGETDPENLKSDFGCVEASVGQCDPAVQEVIRDQVALNRYGSASSLGGRSRLRSFVGNRFSGAHSEFLGAELRWNLTNENTPFDIWIMKDLRTGIQLAFFYETGSVADLRSDLWKTSQYSTGAGIRLVTGSGFIYRFDLAYGDEGVATTLFIDYPWGAL
ncbi:hypothetical protein KKI24_06730 [bacterium]|nr:hypothetical protein [bacterium]